jgi:hypothetical protein
LDSLTIEKDNITIPRLYHKKSLLPKLSENDKSLPVCFPMAEIINLV